MTVETSQLNDVTRFGKKLPNFCPSAELDFSVEPKVDYEHPQPLVMHDSVQGKKFDDHRKLVDSQVIVCDSILENIIEKLYIYQKLDKLGLDRPVARLGDGSFAAYLDYRDAYRDYFTELIDIRRYQKLKKWVDSLEWNEDGTFEIRTNVPFFYQDALGQDICHEKPLFNLDFNELPPILWIREPNRKQRYRFYIVDFCGELREIPRSDCSPFLPFAMSSLRWVDFKKRSENLEECSGKLNFSQILSADGKKRLRLESVEFCRQRLCPVCMWRRSMVWYARFLERFPAIVDAFKNYRLLHLVLTVPNVHISEMRSTLQRMNQGWKRMTNFKVKNPLFPEGKIMKGFLRSVEVTREYEWATKIVLDKKTSKAKEVKYKIGMGREGFVHPHFHVLIAVPSTYMYHGKIPSARWLEVWRDAMQDQSITNVKIQLVQGGKKFIDMDQGSIEDFKKAILRKDTLFGSLPELVKYSTKPTEFSAPFEKGWETAEQRDYFYYKYEREVKHLRFISTGGIFKDILGEDKDVDEVSNEEMVRVGGELSEGETKLLDTLDFSWDKELKHFCLTWINYDGDYEE